MKAADLHLHTTCSDGRLSARELVRLAHGRAVAALAVTDHDTIDGLPEARAESQRFGMELVPGIELSVRHAGQDLHILAYFLDEANLELVAMLADLRADRVRRVEQMVARLQELGQPVTVEAVWARAETKAAIGRPHVAEVLVACGAVERIQDAFRYYIGKDAPAYVPVQTQSLRDSLRILRGAGGVPVLAHPGIYEVDPIWDDLLGAGLMGIEVWHPVHDPGQVQRFLELARKHGLAATGGSDYHGNRDDEVLPGTMPVWTDAVEDLRARHAGTAG